MKLRIALLSGVALFVVTTAHAGFGDSLGGSVGGKAGKVVGKTVDSAASAALIDDLNKDIQKKNCRFKDGKTEFDTTCSLSEVASIISKHRSAIENVFGKKVRISITANAKDRSLAYTRARNVRDNLSGSVSWWRINYTGVQSGSNNLSISAQKY